jgi:O-antigen/teichoic acid export membrane protein
LLGTGVSPVFLQKSAELQKNRPELLGAKTWQLYKTLALIVVLPLGIFYVFGTPFYAWIFGENWEYAGRAAEIISICYFYRLIASPISSLFSVLRKERQQLYFQITLFTLRASALVIGAIYTQDFLELVIIFSVANGLAYFVLCIWLFRLVKYSLLKVVSFTLGTHGIVLFLTHLLKKAIF